MLFARETPFFFLSPVRYFITYAGHPDPFPTCPCHEHGINQWKRKKRPLTTLASCSFLTTTRIQHRSNG